MAVITPIRFGYSWLVLTLVFLTGFLSGCEVLYPVDPATRLLFQDDFADPESGWSIWADTVGSTGYQDDLFWIQVQAPLSNLAASLPMNYRFPADVEIEVDARKAVGSDDNRFGILCRYQDELNYYWLVISSDGYYGIGKVVDGQTMLINRSQLPPSESIHRGAQWNHIQANCIGNTLSLFINGQMVDQQRDNQFTSGGIGLLAGTGVEGQIVVTFDRLQVKKAQQE